MATIFKYNEQPSGLINGVNKVFTLVNTISNIESLRISGLEYTNFTYTGSTITLADAPSFPVYVDYFYTEAGVAEATSGVTFAEVRTAIYTQMGQDETSLQYTTTLVDNYIMEGVKTLTKLTRDKKRRQAYSFTRGSDDYVNGVSTGVITTNTSTSTPGNSYAIIEGGEIVLYTGKTATTITGVSGLAITDVVDRKIQFGYQLPSNVYEVRQVFIDNVEYKGIDIGRSFPQIDGGAVAICKNTLYLPYDTQGEGKVVTVVYEPSPTSSYADTDEMDFDGDYIKVINSYVKYNLYVDREDTRQEAEYRRYKENLKEYKAEMRKQLYPVGGVLRT